VINLETVFIGSKDIKYYLPAAFYALSKSDTIKIVARGRNTKRALDVVAILKRDYLDNPKYNVVIDSEEFKDDRTGDIKKVTSLEIELSGTKKDKNKNE